MSASWIALLLAAIAVFWALGAYNRIIRLRTQVMRSLQMLASLWQAQAQAVGLRLAQFAQGQETQSQWATLDEDALRWRPLALAARQFLVCLGCLQAKPHLIAVPDDVASVRAARDIFKAHWQRLQNEREDLAGAPVPPDLQQLWAEHELLSQERLLDYGQAVHTYHQAIGQFPALLLARLCGFGVTGELSV